MRILMGVDESEFAEDILRALVTQFRTENTEILVLHVLEPVGPAPPQMDPGYAPELEGEKKPAQLLVERIANELQSAGFKVDSEVEVGDIRQRIIDYAVEWRADLIVIGSHGQSPPFSAWKRGGIRR
jgi:nucleotide-binding universal stress UspA family protein